VKIVSIQNIQLATRLFDLTVSFLFRISLLGTLLPDHSSRSRKLEHLL
jgi:hypothetical protein